MPERVASIKFSSTKREMIFSNIAYPYFCPYNAPMSREDGRSPWPVRTRAEGTGAALAQAGDVTAARSRFDRFVIRRAVRLTRSVIFGSRKGIWLLQYPKRYSQRGAPLGTAFAVQAEPPQLVTGMATSHALSARHC